MNRVLFIALVGLLASCSNIPDKPIWVDLESDEIAKATMENPEFKEFYTNFSLALTLYSSNIDKKQYKNVTWRKLFNYIEYRDKLSNDTTIYRKLYDEWTEKYRVEMAKVDSISDYWKKYREQKSIERYINIEFFSIAKSYYWDDFVEDVYFKFKFTPKVKGIEQVRFKYSYCYKIEQNRSNLEEHVCIFSQPLPSATTCAFKMDSDEKERFKDATTASFTNAYDMFIEIVDMRINGKNYSMDDLKIPDAVYTFWKKDDIHTRADVAKLSNPKMISLKEYYEDYYNKKLSGKDKLVFSFMNEMSKQVNE